MEDKRCVHLDFHTSGEIEGIGRDFDHGEFVAALKEAGLDSITVFAKCHHGNLYYPSEKFKSSVHPHLEKPLLDLQVAACKDAGVSAKIYISAGLDDVMAYEHPEWLHVDFDGTAKNLLRPHFKRLCFNSPYLDFLAEQTIEVTERYMPDGLFFDIVGDYPCSCIHCLRDMKKKGLDHTNIEDSKKQAKDVFNKFTKRITEAARSVKPDVMVFYNAGDFPVGRDDRMDCCDQLEAESLPTGGWGYDHFPMSMAYIRRRGKNCIGMTGKFHKTWGEFGGFKYMDALLYEGAQCLAFDAGLSVGDQLHPSGRVDMYTYKNVGNANRYLAARDAWRGGDFQAEFAILSDHPNGRTGTGRTGASRMLFEAKYLFDIIDAREISNKYPLIVLADNHEIDDEEYPRLVEYVKNGGKILAVGKSALYKGENAFDLGAKLLDKDPYSPTYIQPRYKVAAAEDTALAVYAEVYDIEPTGEVLVDKITPYFQRGGMHYCSHNNTPGDYGKVSAAVTEGKDGILLGADLFTDYCDVGSLNAKVTVLPLIERLLGGKKTVKTTLPTSGKATLYKKDGAYILHLLYANTIVRGKNMEVIEDIVTLADVKVSLALPEQVSRVVLQPEGREIPFTVEDGRVNFVLDKFHCHQIIELK